MADWALHLGDCRKELPKLEGGSVDCVVTDPPYNLSANRGDRERGFMNCTWDDTVAFRPEVWAECLRVAKPGAYLLAFGGTRTHHRLMCAVEDAGWDLTDTICWLHAQGFPKGKSCLKPAWEPVVLARKAAPRVLPLNIDECRIGYGGKSPEEVRREAGSPGHHGGPETRGAYNGGWADDSTDRIEFHPAGRYPANLALSHHEACVCRGTRRVPNRAIPYTRSVPATNAVYGTGFGAKPVGQEPITYAGPDGTEEVEDWSCHPECPVFLLDSQAGERTSGGGLRRPNPSRPSVYNAATDKNPIPPNDYTRDASTGNVSRFFYVSKADRADRGEGNDHPTTKSTALMRWLVKLACPPGGLVLDPFCGSGSTGVAALRCGRRFLGIERDPHYHAIALKRLAGVDGPLFAAAPAPEEDLA